MVILSGVVMVILIRVVMVILSGVEGYQDNIHASTPLIHASTPLSMTIVFY